MSTDSSTEASGSKVSMEPMLELGRSRYIIEVSPRDRHSDEMHAFREITEWKVHEDRTLCKIMNHRHEV
ncbi:hypothetical protein Hdeb2414_s0001g00031371 [Helianthus debilis subsp. tardiflorus]